jgi:hypothetical protein
MSPNAGGGVAGSQPMSTGAHGAQINVEDLTQYLSYVFSTLLYVNACILLTCLFFSGFCKVNKNRKNKILLTPEHIALT